MTMTKEMIIRERKATVELFNEISAKYNEFKNKFNLTSECFENTLDELDKKIQLLGQLEDLY